MNRQAATPTGFKRRVHDLHLARVPDPRQTAKVTIPLPTLLAALVASMVTRARSLRAAEQRTAGLALDHGWHYFAQMKSEVGDIYTEAKRLLGNRSRQRAHATYSDAQNGKIVTYTLWRTDLGEEGWLKWTHAHRLNGLDGPRRAQYHIGLRAPAVPQRAAGARLPAWYRSVGGGAILVVKGLRS